MCLRAMRVQGEFGGFYTGKDKEWQDWAIGTLKRRGIGVFYFCLNPDSVDTGGLLESDWTTPERGKLDAIARLPASDVLAIRKVTAEPEAIEPSPPPPGPPGFVASPEPPFPPTPSPPAISPRKPLPPPEPPNFFSMTFPDPEPSPP